MLTQWSLIGAFSMMDGKTSHDLREGSFEALSSNILTSPSWSQTTSLHWLPNLCKVRRSQFVWTQRRYSIVNIFLVLNNETE